MLESQYQARSLFRDVVFHKTGVLYVEAGTIHSSAKSIVDASRSMRHIAAHGEIDFPSTPHTTISRGLE